MSPQPRGARIAAVRGAVPVPTNSPEAIQAATARLLEALTRENRLDPGRIVSAVFTTTDDLDADFPAHAARRLGWTDVPMLNAREIPVPGSLPRIVRVLLTIADVPEGARLTPVYLDAAAALRPDLAPRIPDAPQAPAARTAAHPAPTRTRRIAIIGLGQIGGSIALALGRAPGWVRVGHDADRATAGLARAAHALDVVAGSVAAACAGADLAVIATPVDTLAGLVAEAAAALPRGAALLDTGSARGPVSDALAAAAARGLAAVGGHPIAGNEGHGFGSARADLFRGATWVLCPTGAAVPAAVAELLRDLGARPLVVPADEHDHALARTSHLPWALACALNDLGGAFAARGLAGPGFRDMTRLAASDPRMAGAFARANAAEIAAAWRELRAAMDARVEQLGTDGRKG